MSQIRKRTVDGNWKHVEPFCQLCYGEWYDQYSKVGEETTETHPSKRSLVDSLRTTAKNPEDATKALSAISTEVTNDRANGDEEKLEAVLQTMMKYLLRPTIQAQACDVLLECASSNDDTRSVIGKHGGIDAILAAMKEHLKVAEFQEQACGALWYLSANNGNNKIEIAAKGGIDAILRAMKEHPKAAAVQASACGALWILTLGNDRNAIDTAAKGGTVAALSALEQHPANFPVEEHTRGLACGLLVHLAFYMNNGAGISSRGVVAALLAVL